MKKGILLKKIGVLSIAFMRTSSPFASFSASGLIWFSFLMTSSSQQTVVVRYTFHDAALLCSQAPVTSVFRVFTSSLAQVVAQILYVLASKNTLVISTLALRLSTHLSPVCVHNAFVLFALFQMVQLVHLNFVFLTASPEPLPSPHSTTVISSSRNTSAIFYEPNEENPNLSSSLTTHKLLNKRTRIKTVTTLLH